MFDTLTDRFDAIFTRLRGRGRLGDAEVAEVLREIRVALLEADVNLAVVRDLIEAIRARCTGAELAKHLTPAQQVIKVVNEELTATLGGEALKISYASKPPTVVLLAGLQGSGKTTAAAKLARWFRQQGRHPYLIGADLQRPAAVEQLRVLGAEIGVGVFSEPTDPVSVARGGLAEAERHLGDFADARDNYKKVMEYDPGSRHAKESGKALQDPEIANAKPASSGQPAQQPQP